MADTDLQRRALTRRGLMGAAAASPVLFAPAVMAQTRRTLRLATGAGTPELRASADRLAVAVADMSGGRFRIELGEALAGAAGPATLGADADAILGLSDNWLDLDPAFGLFAGCPFGLSPREHEAWVLQGDGRRIWDTLGERHGMKPLFAGDLGPRAVGWFKTELTAAADLSGKRMRTRGLGALVAQALGAVPFDGPPADAAAADMTESYGLAADLEAGLPRSFDVLHTPAALTPNTAITLGVALPVWQALGDAEKLMLEAAATAEADYLNAMIVQQEMAAYEAMEAAGVRVVPLSPQVFAGIASVAIEALATRMTEGSALPDVWLDYVYFLDEISRWTSIGDSAFSVARAKALGIAS